MHITLLGAGGKMGGRITANLQHLPQYKIDYVESSEERQKQMAAAGTKTTPLEEALGKADGVILGVPDKLIGKVTREIVPKLKTGNCDWIGPRGGLCRGDAKAGRHHVLYRPSLPPTAIFGYGTCIF
jgi:N-acetyl-gamma-glutamylphosphate reductase